MTATMRVPSPAQAVVNRGAVLHLAGDLAGAEAAYREGLEVDADNPVAHANLAFLLAVQDRHEEAREHFHHALALDPTAAATWANAGITELWLGNVEAGVDALLRAVRLDPDYAHAWDSLGRVFAARGAWADAEEAWRSAVVADPDVEDAFVSLATAIAAQERVADAADVLRDAARRFPESVRVAAQLGAVCLVRQDWGSAADALARALELDPDDPGARFHAGLLALLVGAPEEAAPHFEAVAAAPEGTPHRHEARALLTQLAATSAPAPAP